MTDLIKEFRELLGCSDGYCKFRDNSKGQHTNGGCQCFTNVKYFLIQNQGFLPKLLDDLEEKEEYIRYLESENKKEIDKVLAKSEYFIKDLRHKKALEQASLNVEASQKAARAYCDELARYKKALEVCRSQRDSYIDQLANDRHGSDTIVSINNKKLDQILEVDT